MDTRTFAAIPVPLPHVGRRCVQSNFGGNHVWEARCYQPASEKEVLEILARHKHGRIRVTGARHSWSDVAAGDDVSLDMSRFDTVRLPAGGEQVVHVGAGCTLQRLLDELHSKSDRTLPTMGVIKRQTVAGAISTGTHGSGTQGMSHFVKRVRVAGYDPATGEPRIYEHAAGNELKASRCGLGCTGVILSVDFETVPQYMVEETVHVRKSLDEVLARYGEFPLSQFVYVPYEGDFVAFERRVYREGLGFFWPANVVLFRLLHVVIVDWLSHAGVKLALWLGNWSVRPLLHFMPKSLLPIRNRKRVDFAERVLTMEHDLFQHEEMEIFVRASQLPQAIKLLRAATLACAGDALTPEDEAIIATGGFDAALRGSYTLHYPFSIRRVLPEDTLLSMASGAPEPVYSISVFTYERPDRRARYYVFCGWLARAMTNLHDARLHWGKHFAQSAEDVERLYPELPVFKGICAGVDPDGVFRNEYTCRVLGMPHGQPSVPRKCVHEVA